MGATCGMESETLIFLNCALLSENSVVNLCEPELKELRTNPETIAVEVLAYDSDPVVHDYDSMISSLLCRIRLLMF